LAGIALRAKPEGQGFLRTRRRPLRNRLAAGLWGRRKSWRLRLDRSGACQGSPGLKACA